MNKPQTATLPIEMTAPSKAPLLGRIVAWSIGGVALSRDQLVRICIESGIDDRHLPKVIQTRSCVLRTLDRLEGDGFVRRIVEEPDRAVFVLVTESIDRDREAASYETARRFTYDKRAKVVTCDDPGTQALIDGLMGHFSDCYLPADIRRFVLDVVKDAGALTLRDRGGVYFLAESKLAIVDALSRFFDAMGPGSSLLALNVPRSPADVAGVMKVFEAEAMGDLEALAAELTDLEADPTKVRPSTWQKRITGFKEQRAKVGMYADLLECEAKRYLDRLTELERRVHVQLVG